MKLSDTPNKPVVAFAGTYRGVMHRIGLYKNLEIRDTLMMLRRRRASAVQADSPFDRIIQKLVAYEMPDGETCVPEDIFEEILEYL